MDLELSDWLNSVYYNKKDLIKDNPTGAKSYPSFIINRFLAGNLDTILYANELNERYTMDKEMQYKFLLYALPKKKRYSSYIKKSKLDYLDSVKQYYGYNTEKSLEAINLLSKEQLEFIKKSLDTGGYK